ncbi:hypothetical protein D3C80_1503330 [compost metagenome]
MDQLPSCIEHGKHGLHGFDLDHPPMKHGIESHALAQPNARANRDLHNEDFFQ